MQEPRPQEFNLGINCMTKALSQKKIKIMGYFLCLNMQEENNKKFI